MPLNLSVQLLFSVYLTKTAMQASYWKVTWSVTLQRSDTTEHMHTLSPRLSVRLLTPGQEDQGILCLQPGPLGEELAQRPVS